MAKRRRRKSAKSNPPRRRRRRRHAVARINPPHRHVKRRRRHHSNPPRRRHYRRNPGLAGSFMEDGKNGLGVVAGQVVTRKISSAAAAMLPAPAAGSAVEKIQNIGLRLGAAALTAFLARKFAPRGLAAFVAAGAFGEAINWGLAQTPVAPFLGALPARRALPLPMTRVGRVAAWPRSLPAGVGAWPKASRPMMAVAGH